MTFLNPAVLFGLFAAAIPVLLHLLNLRKLKRIEFSTLTFLKELQKNKIRKIKLKQWLLLALRFLIIVFIVTSFARPALKGISIGGTTSSAKTTAVFILDNTASMSVVDEKGSYFNRAKQVIKSLLLELQEGDEVALILVSDVSFKEIATTTNLDEFKKLVDQTDISPVSGSLHNAIIKAGKVLSASNNFNKEVYLLSDFQKSRLHENNESLSDLSHLFNEKVRLYSIDFHYRSVYNLGIDQLELNNQILEKNKTISFSANMTNYSAQNAENTVASLFINGERSAQQSVSLQPGETKKIGFETILKNSGTIEVHTEIEDDDILQDNKNFLSFSLPDKVSVLIFTDAMEDALFVETALSAANSEGNINVVKKNMNQISSVSLENFDAVVLIGSESITSPGRLTAYLNNGGRIFLMPGSNSSLNSFKALCSNLGMPGPVSAAGTVNSSKNISVFDKIDFEHPLFANIFAGNAKRQIESPEIYHYFVSKPQGQGKSLINLIDNNSFLSEFSVEKGKVLVMYCAPVLGWSNLPVKSIFAPLIHKTVLYLSSKDNNSQSVFAGQRIDLNLQNTTLPQLKIIRPDKSEDYISLDKNNRNYVSYSNTTLIGNYKIFSGDKLINYFSVNNNPLESRPAYLSKAEFNDYLNKIHFKGTRFNLDSNEDYMNKVRQARFGSELWRYFVLIALFLALFEMRISRSAKKDVLTEK